MTRLSILIASLGISVIVVSATAGTVVSAHGGNEHLRGVVTQLSPQAITIETTGKKTRTLNVTKKTTFQLAGKAAQPADLKVGDRVVVDVPEKSSDALLVQIGTAAAAGQTTAPAKKPVR